jgi:hypothetical protein
MEVLFVLVIFGAIVAIVISRHSKALSETWSEGARRLDLRLQTGRKKALRGVRPSMQILVQTKSVGKSQWTEYVATFREALPLQIKLSPQGYFPGVTNSLFNRADIEIGDRNFDSGITIEGADPDRVREFLDPEVVHSIKRLVARFDQFEINQYGITVFRTRVTNNVEMLTKDVELLEKVALFLIHKANSDEDMENTEPSKSPQPPPVPRKGESEKSEAGPKPPPIPYKKNDAKIEETPVETIEKPVKDLEESLDSESNEAEAETSESEVIEEITEEPEAELTILDEDQPSAPVPTETISPIVEQWMMQFSEATGRYAFSKIFETFWKDQAVAGEATLQSVEAFSMDRVFGRGPGHRLHYDLGQLENGDTLQLVSNAPADSDKSQLQSQIGKPVEFQGLLIGCDAFTQTLFLQVSPSEVDG